MITCKICSNTVFSRKIFNNLPVSSAVLYNDELPIENTAEFTALICDNCIHISNEGASRLKIKYSSDDYVTKKAVSRIMSDNLRQIADFICPDDISNSKILEIGSGAGEIAKWFSEKAKRVVTVDPSIYGYDDDKIIHYQESFSKDFVSKINDRFDLIIARHLIEHMEYPYDFLTSCKILLNQTGKIYIEVPDLENTLETNRIIDFFNDHIQHFSKNSMRFLINKIGFRECKISNWLNGAHFGILITPREKRILDSIKESENKLNNILETMNEFTTIALYGAGAHCSTFVSQLGNEHKNKISYIFDKSTEKQGKFVPGLNVKISEPRNLNQDLIVNTSCLYKKEIEEYLTTELKVSCPIIHL